MKIIIKLFWENYSREAKKSLSKAIPWILAITAVSVVLDDVIYWLGK